MKNVDFIIIIHTDNKRFLHARDVFTGERRVWRVWWWSDRCTDAQLEFAEAERAHMQAAS